MDQDTALQILRQMLIATAMVAAPILLANLVIGVLISIVQVVTQVQEATLTFVPKLIITLLLALIMGKWMLNSSVEFTLRAFAFAAKVRG